MESPNPKYILSLVPLCGRAPDVLQIVQVFYTERDLFKAQVRANSSEFLLVGRNTKKLFSASRTTPGSTLIESTAFAEWGWLPGLALNSSSKDCSHCSGWAHLSCNYTASYWQYSRRSLGQNLQAAQETFSLIHLNVTIQFSGSKKIYVLLNHCRSSVCSS